MQRFKFVMVQNSSIPTTVLPIIMQESIIIFRKTWESKCVILLYGYFLIQQLPLLLPEQFADRCRSGNPVYNQAANV